jgi:ACS family D-galactonate transporter-like MFS transporter
MTGQPRARWGIACLLGFGVLVNYFDRVNLSVAHDGLVASFAISSVTFGYLSAAYNWTYAACQLPVGVLLDRFGVRRVGIVSTLLWSAASFAAAAASSVNAFFGARFLLGVGEAPTFPANAKAIGLWFPENERSVATSCFDAAAKLASGIGVPLLGILLLHLGWRWSFIITGIISLLYFALFFLLYRDPPATPSVVHILELEPLQREASLGFLIRQRKVLGLAIGFGSYNYVFYLLLTWLPSYLSATLHIDLLHSFLYTSVPWLLATVTELITAFTVDALIRRGWDASRVRKAVLIGGTTFGLGIIGAVHAHTAVSALLWISISISGLSAASPIGWSIPSMIAPRGGVGTVGGIVNFSNQLSGIAAPIITGYVVAQTREYAWAFGISAIYLLVGIASYLFLLGRIEPIVQREP